MCDAAPKTDTLTRQELYHECRSVLQFLISFPFPCSLADHSSLDFYFPLTHNGKNANHSLEMNQAAQLPLPGENIRYFGERACYIITRMNLKNI